jgi:hypothetical protein
VFTAVKDGQTTFLKVTRDFGIDRKGGKSVKDRAIRDIPGLVGEDRMNCYTNSRLQLIKCLVL